MDNPQAKPKWRQQGEDIFTTISTGDFNATNYRKALMLYIEDMSFERAAISYADKKLAEFYRTK